MNKLDKELKDIAKNYMYALHETILEYKIPANSKETIIVENAAMLYEYCNDDNPSLRIQIDLCLYFKTFHTVGLQITLFQKCFLFYYYDDFRLLIKYFDYKKYFVNLAIPPEKISSDFETQVYKMFSEGLEYVSNLREGRELIEQYKTV